MRHEAATLFCEDLQARFNLTLSRPSVKSALGLHHNHAEDVTTFTLRILTS